MPSLARAIDQGQWELVALCLAIGLAETMIRLPAELIIELAGRPDSGGEDERH